MPKLIMDSFYRINFPCVFLITTLLVVNGCTLESPCSTQEISRINSYDKVVDAVIVKTDCGATTDYSYSVFITSNGKKAIGKSVFLADKVDGLAIKWTSSKQLLLTYNEARIFKFTNFWQSEEIENFEYIVSITEVSRTSVRR